jgi:predicted AlkP superfamily pyrophosphatase or phosphodiesterase
MRRRWTGGGVTGPALALAGLALAAGAGVGTLPGVGLPLENGSPDARPPADHVILITIDGLRPEFYLDRTWPAPALQKMAVEGAHALALRGVIPTNTYPSHTTLVTGALPGRHGILYNRPFEPEGATGVWYMEHDQIQVDALWDATRAAGLTSAGISWPVSAGAPIDWNVPEFWSVSGQEGDLSGPAAHTAALRARTQPAGLLEWLEEEALGRFPDTYWGRNLTREDAVGSMAAVLIETHRPNLLLVHLNQTDYFQHLHGREHPEVRASVAAVDRALARMVEASERAGILERTAFLVAGDHGFVNVDTRLAPNVWLVDAGLHGARADRGPDWRAAFHSGGGSVFLKLRDPGDAGAVEEVRQMLAGLDPGFRGLFRVVDGEEVRRRGGDPEAVLALDAAPGAAFVLDTEGDPIRPGSGGAHGYFPDIPEIHSGFVAWGSGVGRGRSLHLLGMEDVAPLAAALLGIRLDAPDGVLRPGILAESP